jgi:UDP-glucose 4-epimerase
MILVTGGAGFIGSHIVDRLIAGGKEVLVVDDLSSGKKENLSPSAVFHKLDVCSEKALAKVFSENEITAVVHEAAQISVVRSVEEPALDAGVNVLGTINVLECCRRFGVKKFVYASSGGAVYGEPKTLPMREDHPIAPLCPYGLSKYASELYIQLYHRLYGLDYTIVRYSNVYGPRQDPCGEAGVVAIFSEKLLSGTSPTIFGDGAQTRDFVYVGDVADATVRALGKGKNDAFNVCTCRETSVNEIFELIRKSAGREGVEPVFEEARAGEILRCSLDYSKAKRDLGWVPKVGIEDGIRMTVDYFRSQRRR